MMQSQKNEEDATAPASIQTVTANRANYADLCFQPDGTAHAEQLQGIIYHHRVLSIKKQ
jgi:hypothetical protein